MTKRPTGEPGDNPRWMEAALNLGERSLGLAAPNPSVGAILVKDGAVVGRAQRRRAGVPTPNGSRSPRPERRRAAPLLCDARTVLAFRRNAALRRSGREAGIARVVSAIEDPNPKVAGQGHARLRKAGIEVEWGRGPIRRAATIAAISYESRRVARA